MKSFKSVKREKMSNIERTSSAAADSGFWTTIELLMGREWKDENGEENREADGRNLIRGEERRGKRSLRNAGMKINSLTSVIKHLENGVHNSTTELRNSWSRQREMASGQDRENLQRLQQRSSDEKIDAQHRRMKAREAEEMDRLKKLILSGRSPLDDCPPEMKSHPVFVFWRVVNKEVDKMNKARVDAYYKKYRRTRRGTRRNSQRDPPGTEEVSLVSLEGSQVPNNSPVAERPTAGTPPREESLIMPLATKIKPKYEDEGVKQLRNLTTVEELYQMADKIIGVPKVDNPI